MAHPRFSIVIPTYNRSDLVCHTIQSVLNQTFADFEIIASDNCSTDDTATVVGEFKDPRVKYVKTPRHVFIADNWEFARSHARGDLLVMLGDDDALLPSALDHFDRAATRHDADFLFCRTVWYRDLGFPGSGRNTLECSPFSGSTRVLSSEEFLTPLFSCRLVYDMHPSSFFFSRALGDAIAKRNGRFFQTNGVEYCAWPMAAAFAKHIALVDLPLSICGRTKKSWGSNLVLANPGKQRIQTFIADVEHKLKHAPLKNFSMPSLRAEGVLTAKELFPQEFEPYQFDDEKNMWDTWSELKSREALGVDVSRDMEELVSHLDKYPQLRQNIADAERAGDSRPWWQRVRTWIGDLGLRDLRDRRSNRLRVRRGDVQSGFKISGYDFGFTDIVEGAAVLERLVATSTPGEQDHGPVMTGAPSFSQ